MERIVTAHEDDGGVADTAGDRLAFLDRIFRYAEREVGSLR
jgi:hypothetical protein